VTQQAQSFDVVIIGAGSGIGAANRITEAMVFGRPA
jgi:cation diffusion facilitator CzcD-associated flavoprotein CzcO